MRVDLYWANPALQVTRTNATLVGSAYADVPAGGVQDALCLVPWIPMIVNSGHECLVAVANHPSDPLPSPLPNAFDPPTYRQVAQTNLTVLAVGPGAEVIAITLAGLERLDKSVLLTAEVGGELDQRSLTNLGLGDLRPAKRARAEVGFDRERRCPGPRDPIGKERLELEVRRGTSTAVHVAVRAKNLAANEYQLVEIVERDNERVLGGLGFVLVSEKAGKADRREKRS